NLRVIGTTTNHDVHIQRYKQSSEGIQALHHPLGPTPFDKEVPPLDPTRLTHRLEEDRDQMFCRFAARDTHEPNAGYLLRLLRLGCEWRESETDSENDREPDQPHGASRWRMAGGSLADGG